MISDCMFQNQEPPKANISYIVFVIAKLPSSNNIHKIIFSPCFYQMCCNILANLIKLSCFQLQFWFPWSLKYISACFGPASSSSWFNVLSLGYQTSISASSSKFQPLALLVTLASHHCPLLAFLVALVFHWSDSVDLIFAILCMNIELIQSFNIYLYKVMSVAFKARFLFLD